MISEGTIMALSTATGAGAIALIRLSGTNAIDITETVFKARSGKLLKDQKSHSIHLGDIINNKSVIDEVLVSIFKNPHSYTS